MNASVLKSDMEIRRKCMRLWTGGYSIEMLHEVVVPRSFGQLTSPRSQHQCETMQIRKKSERIRSLSKTGCVLRNKTQLMLNNRLLLGAGGAKCYEA